MLDLVSKAEPEARAMEARGDPLGKLIAPINYLTGRPRWGNASGGSGPRSEGRAKSLLKNRERT